VVDTSHGRVINREEENHMRKTVTILTVTILAIGTAQVDAKDKVAPNVSEISVTKKTDSSTPTMMHKAGKRQTEYMKYKFNDATISNYSQKSSISPSAPKAGYDVKRSVK
jgi:type VI protein secretion system component Hcp